MNQEQQRLLSTTSDVALKPLLQTIKDCDASNTSTIRTLILRAFAHPEIFAGFDEIKLAVKDALASTPDGEALLRTLDLFSYGTFREYTADASRYISLTESQLNKLKMLSVVSLIQKSCCSSTSLGKVEYRTVAQELGIAAAADDNLDALRQVEEIIIACIYADLVKGRLCQKTKTLTCSSEHGPPCFARDVSPAQVSSMLETLRKLQQNADTAIVTMDEEIAMMEGNRLSMNAFWHEIDKTNNKIQGETTKERPTTSSTSGGWPTSSRSARLQDLSVGASSSTPSRQAKRSRGGLSGLVEPFARF